MRFISKIIIQIGLKMQLLSQKLRDPQSVCVCVCSNQIIAQHLNISSNVDLVAYILHDSLFRAANFMASAHC